MAKRKRKNRSYSDEFKQEAVRLMENRGESTVAEVAASISVKPSQLYEWKRALGEGPSTRVNGESLEEENERLRREMAQMRKENETLKKSIALFAKDLKL
jgi:transposase